MTILFLIIQGFTVTIPFPSFAECDKAKTLIVYQLEAQVSERNARNKLAFLRPHSVSYNLQCVALAADK